ncbi:MAG: hypothetical protein ACJATT_004141 [Myxococcota bacterium]|jgi:hypothetical protein
MLPSPMIKLHSLALICMLSAPLMACNIIFGADPAASIGTTTVPSEWVFLGLPNIQLVTDASESTLEVSVSGNPLYVAADMVESTHIDGWTPVDEVQQGTGKTLTFSKGDELLTVIVTDRGSSRQVRASRMPVQ